MEVTIHDVGHGSFISLVEHNAVVTVWDCGHDEGLRPSLWCEQNHIRRIHNLIVTNYDEDHISDLCDLMRRVEIKNLLRNTTITANELKALKLKSGSLSASMKCLLDMIDRYTISAAAIGTIYANRRVFCNRYIFDFVDTNNISLVTFVDCGNHRMIIPGDLERAGWTKLLARPDFVRCLSRVNVFVASHHGRESGYCPAVFNYCTPDVVIFSDGPIEYGTQDMADVYAKHANGIWFRRHTRYVLSTRNDGTISGNGEVLW